MPDEVQCYEGDGDPWPGFDVHLPKARDELHFASGLFFGSIKRQLDAVASSFDHDKKKKLALARKRFEDLSVQMNRVKPVVLRDVEWCRKWFNGVFKYGMTLTEALGTAESGADMAMLLAGVEKWRAYLLRGRGD